MRRNSSAPGRKRVGLRSLRAIAPSDEMKAWAAALAGELATWPKVRSRAFFGFTAVYREDRIFALFPRTRALEPANSLAFKLKPTARMAALARGDSRMGSTQMQKASWFTFAVSAEADLRDALEWLLRAYEAAI